MFAILEERASGGRSLVARDGPGISHCMYIASFPASPYYAILAHAERDAEWFRADNARRVEDTKRRRKYKTLPATYSVIEVTDVSVGERAVDLQADYVALAEVAP